MILYKKHALIISFKPVIKKLKCASLKFFININNSDSSSIIVTQYFAFTKYIFNVPSQSPWLLLSVKPLYKRNLLSRNEYDEHSKFFLTPPKRFSILLLYLPLLFLIYLSRYILLVSLTPFMKVIKKTYNGPVINGPVTTTILLFSLR